MGASVPDDSKKEIKKKDYIKEQRIEGSLDSLPRWKSKKIDEQLEKAICRIKIYVKEIEKLKFGTGFLCKIPNPDEFVLLPVLITNNHIIDEKKYKENREIEITFDDEKRTKKINTDLQRKFYTSEIYDITIIEILPNIDDLHYFLEISLENINFFENKNLCIYLLHYPRIKESQVSYGILKNISNEFEIEHECCTEEGSSGAPILLKDTLKIIGIHKGYPKNNKTINLGILLKYPLLEFNNSHEKEINNKLNHKINNEINNEINKDIKNEIYNEIIIKLKIDKKDLNRDIFILNKPYDYKGELDEEVISLKELNKLNTLMYINNQKVEYGKYKKFNKIGIYEIKLIININITDAKYMFYKCENIIDINMSKFNTKNIISMKGMFYDCSHLQSIDLSSFNTENVINMSLMFCGCENLKNINLLSFNVKNVKNMYAMFCSCHILENIDLSSFDTKNVNNMERMFLGCYNLESINLSASFNTKNVTNMKEMFCYCENLKSVDLLLFDTKNVTNMDGMFCECKNLKNIDLSKFNKKTIFLDLEY